MRRSFWVVLAITSLLGAKIQPYSLVVVKGNSMSPTFVDGSLQLAHRIDKPLKRGDVVIVRRNGETLVKRVAFLPGDRITMYESFGEWLLPPVSRYITVAEQRGWPLKTFQIPEGTVYLLGDNSFESRDSRQFGPVRTEEIESVIENAPAAPDTRIAGVTLHKA